MMLLKKEMPKKTLINNDGTNHIGKILKNAGFTCYQTSEYYHVEDEVLIKMDRFVEEDLGFKFNPVYIKDKKVYLFIEYQKEGCYLQEITNLFGEEYLFTKVFDLLGAYQDNHLEFYEYQNEYRCIIKIKTELFTYTFDTKGLTKYQLINNIKKDVLDHLDDIKHMQEECIEIKNKL